MPGTIQPFDRSSPLRGRDLRHAALVVLHRTGLVLTIAEIAAALQAADFRVAGDNANKALADGLRHEVKRGRARRVSRGRYSVGALPRTTAWRIGRRMDSSPPLSS